MYNITSTEIEARFNEWASRVSGRNYMKMQYCKESMQYIPFADCTTMEAQHPVPVRPTCKEPKKIKKEENMYVEQNMTVKEKTTEDSRLEHFIHRIDRLSWDKENDMMEHFGLKRKSPKNPKEMVEWIKEGNFIFTKEVEDDESDHQWYSLLNGIKWTKIKEDRKGFEKAMKEMEKSKKDYIDLMWAEVDPGKFPEIVKKFAKEKFH